MTAPHPTPQPNGADLPAEVSDLCARVARKTRLRRREREDVRRELASHFHEALAAGRRPAEAVEAFGDPAVAARSLRAAAIAKRSPLDRALGQAFRVAGWVSAGALALYATFAAYLWSRSPVISIDSLAQYRARLASPARPEDNAWPLYQQAFLELGFAAGDPEQQSEGFKATTDGSVRPGDPQWPSAVAWLDAHRAALDHLRDAARRPVFGFPAAREFDADDERLFGKASADTMRTLIADRNEPSCFPMFGLLLPQLATARQAPRILCADAFHAAIEGDGDRMVADIEATMAVSVHVQDGRTLIGDLVGIAIRSVARATALELLERMPDLLDAMQLDRLQRALTGVPPALERLDMGAERLMWVDIEQRLFTDDGSGNGWFRLDQRTFDLVGNLQSVSPATGANNAKFSIADAIPLLGSPAAAIAVADRRETRKFFDHWANRFEEVSTLPIRDHGKVSLMDQEFEVAVVARPIKFLLPRLLMPAIAQVCLAYAQDRAWSTACGTACAALRFRRDTGAWPQRAEALVPKYLGAVPEDPWTGAPVRMGGEGPGFRIWSVGQDLADDGGDPGVDERSVDGRSESTICFRRHAESTGQDAATPATGSDWVWFAPRGNGARWAGDAKLPPG